MALCFVGLVANAHAGVVFQDDFSTNSVANWSFYGFADPWVAADGKLQSALSQTLHHPAGPSFATINGVATSQHFKIEGDVQVVGPVPNASGNPMDWGHVGFFWGKTGAADFSTGYLRTHTDHVTAWKSEFSGEVITLAGSSTSNAPDINGSSYHLSFEVDYQAQTMIVGIGSVFATYSGAAFANANSNGGIGGGLGVISWGERVSYDNVVVTDFMAPVPEPETYAMMAMGLGLLGLVRRRKQMPLAK